MGKYQTYPEYKDSGVEWLGRIPSHWKTGKLKHSVQDSRPITYGIVQCGPNVDEGVYYIRPIDMSDEGGVQIEHLQKTEAIIAASYKRSSLKKGDIVVSIGPSFGKTMMVPVTLEGANLTQGTARVAAASDFNARFLFWLLRSTHAPAFWTAKSSGATFVALTLENLTITPMAFPIEHEQANIAAFLDRETAKIDRLIAKQEALIALLKEKRQAVISHAVTKGLDPDAPMKDSGVEWLGEIPAHWEVKPLMRLVEDKRPIMYGIVLPGPNVDEGVPIVKGGDVKPGRLKLDQLCRTTHEIEAGYARSRLRYGDIVYSIRGSIGDAELVPREIEGANLTQDAARIAPDQNVYKEWLVHAVACKPVFEQLASKSMGAAVKGINIRDLKKAMIPSPPFEEQVKIAHFLHDTLEEMGQLNRAADKAISLMQERRTALISAAVTGKIDVREEMAETLPSVETALAVEILNRCAGNCGRVKLQKLLFLAEHHGGIDVDSNYCRQAAGPMDGTLLDRVESEMEAFGYYRKCKHADGSYSYLKMENAGKGTTQCAYPSERMSKGLHIVNALADKNTHECEAIATVYGAWNDLLIAGKDATRTAVIDEIMNRWHQSKRQTPRSEWLQWYEWVKVNLRPVGYGKATTGIRSFQRHLLG